MKLVIACAAVASTFALFASPVFADEVVASSGTDSVRLSDSPCSNEQVLSKLSPRAREVLRDATAVVQGQQFRACWLVDGQAAHLLYEDGDQGLIPLSDFKLPKAA
jgi:hypothetical protein